MGRLDDCEKEYKTVIRPRMSLETLFVHRPVNDWLARTSEASGFLRVDILNRAIGYAAFRQLAIKHGLQMVLRDDKVAHELPLLTGPFVYDEETDVRTVVRLTATNGRLLEWMSRERGLTPETAAHDGLRITGATVAMPEMGLCIVEDNANSLEVATLNLASAPPFPAE